MKRHKGLGLSWAQPWATRLGRAWLWHRVRPRRVGTPGRGASRRWVWVTGYWARLIFCWGTWVIGFLGLRSQIDPTRIHRSLLPVKFVFDFQVKFCLSFLRRFWHRFPSFFFFFLSVFFSSSLPRSFVVVQRWWWIGDSQKIDFWVFLLRRRRWRLRDVLALCGCILGQRGLFGLVCSVERSDTTI